MNIYYELELLDIDESDDPRILKMKELANENLVHISQKFKYRIMWELRHLEKEINKDGGMIIITKENKIHTKEFSEETSTKIGQALSEINWSIW